MPLKSSHRSGSTLTRCLIFVLSIVFLAPLYHSHDHAADHHPAVSDDHVSLDAGPAQDDLAADQRHSDSHLHIKHNIGRTDTTLRLKNPPWRPGLSTLAESPVTTEDLATTIIIRAQTCVFQCNTPKHLSGLSPPAA
ncbi:MAG: hypothetical protein HZB62_11810 [Nitrospirae bacterium]|nr:hypothetical protein [Nitrospirota bacterium]